MNKTKLGYALTGSFCTFEVNMNLMASLSASYEIVPIMSFNAANLDTRFGKAADFIARIEEMCGKKVIRTIEGAEPIGPQHMTDIVLVSPCTGNTLAKLANSIVDTSHATEITPSRNEFCNILPEPEKSPPLHRGD